MWDEPSNGDAGSDEREPADGKEHEDEEGHY